MIDLCLLIILLIPGYIWIQNTSVRVIFLINTPVHLHHHFLYLLTIALSLPLSACNNLKNESILTIIIMQEHHHFIGEWLLQLPHTSTRRLGFFLSIVVVLLLLLLDLRRQLHVDSPSAASPPLAPIGSLSADLSRPRAPPSRRREVARRVHGRERQDLGSL